MGSAWDAVHVALLRSREIARGACASCNSAAVGKAGCTEEENRTNAPLFVLALTAWPSLLAMAVNTCGRMIALPTRSRRASPRLCMWI